MNDPMNPLVQFSPFAGHLTEVSVPGESSKKADFENDVRSSSGAERSMWCYAPLSGCPDPKQTQILFVLRDDDTRESAQSLLENLELITLAEEEHFLILFPNPLSGGWEPAGSHFREDDLDCLMRCFGILRESPIRINGFNGMLFYLATDPSSSALLADLIALRPGDVSAAMMTKLPSDYSLPEKALNVEAAAWCCPGIMEEYLKKANRATAGPDSGSCMEYIGNNPEVRLFISDQSLSAGLVRTAWDRLFSRSRRWQNDTYGCYHHRTSFTKEGFIPHVNDTSLGVNDGFPHTWYEYVPPQLRCEPSKNGRKIPLVFYFHGINCVPLYGAEQSCWHDIADREDLIVVYPAPARYKAWNIYNLPSLPSDIDFILALLEHMKELYPVDESRVYLSGFSMGGAMTHALASVYPELFAAAAPCNAFSFSRFLDPYVNLSPFLTDMDEEAIGHISYTTRLADAKKTARPDLRMPLFQSAGMDDALIAKWPYREESPDIRSQTLDWWKDFNNIPLRGEDASQISGMKADESFWMTEENAFSRSAFSDNLSFSGISGSSEGQSDIHRSFLTGGRERFLHQRWYSSDPGRPALLELVLARRMAHAIDPIEIEWAWEYMKQFSRKADGGIVFCAHRDHRE